MSNIITLRVQGLSVDDKRNRWESSDGRTGIIEPFSVDLLPKGGLRPDLGEEGDDAGTGGEADAGGTALSEKGRRELARQVRPFSLPKPVQSRTCNA